LLVTSTDLKLDPDDDGLAVERRHAVARLRGRALPQQPYRFCEGTHSARCGTAGDLARHRTRQDDDEAAVSGRAAQEAVSTMSPFVQVIGRREHGTSHATRWLILWRKPAVSLHDVRLLEKTTNDGSRAGRNKGRQMITIIAVAALFFVVLLVGFIGIALQMRIDRKHGRYYKWWQYIEIFGFELKHMDNDSIRWLLAFAIASTVLFTWLLLREFHVW
jgi:hypothetical protein